MLVLSRRVNEMIVKSGNIRVTVVGLRGNQIRLGIEAPISMAIFRQELVARSRTEDQSGARSEVCPTHELERTGSRSDSMRPWR
jgi:carbon storage regulator